MAAEGGAIAGAAHRSAPASMPECSPEGPPLGLRDGVPAERVSSRELAVLGGVEIGRHRFLPGETLYPPLPGPLINLHLGPPTRLVTRRNGRTWEGTQPPGAVEILSAHGATEQVLRDPSDDASVLLPDGFLHRVAEGVGLDPDRVEIVDRLDGRDPRLEALLCLFLPELAGAGLGGELYAESLATALAVHLLRAHSSLATGLGGTLGRDPAGRLPERALSRVVDHVEAHLAGDVSLDRLAAVAGFSARHFLRLFRASTGLSPHQYLIRARVERAKTLLAGGELPLAQVAAAAGFAHQQHLARHFGRLVGVSPGRYRRLVSR